MRYFFLAEEKYCSQPAASFPWFWSPSSCYSHCTDQLQQLEQWLWEQYNQLSRMALV
jgi:hypothetical protein